MKSLFAALEAGEIELAKTLIKAGADLNAVNQAGNTPLLMAVLNNWPLIKPLVEAGADVNVANREGKTPLALLLTHRFSAYLDTSEFIQCLIDHGAHLDITDHQGNNLLHLAIWNPIHIFKLLLQQNIAIDAMNHDQQTPLHLAVDNRQWDKAAVLIEQGANLNVADRKDLFPLELIPAFDLDLSRNNTFFKQYIPKMLKSFPRSKMPANAHDLIHIASKLDDVDLLNQLLQYPIPVQVLNDSLQSAVQSRSYAIVDLLLQHVADVNSTIFDNQESLLHIAVSYFDLEMVKKLIAAGARIEPDADLFRTPFEVWIPGEKNSFSSHVGISRRIDNSEIEQRYPQHLAIFKLLAAQLGSFQHPLLADLLQKLVVFSKAEPWSLIELMITQDTPLPSPSPLNTEKQENHFWKILLPLTISHHVPALLEKLLQSIPSSFKADYLALAAIAALQALNQSIFKKLIQLGLDVNQPLAEYFYKEMITSNAFQRLFHLAREKPEKAHRQEIENFMLMLLDAGYNAELLTTPRSSYSIPTGCLHYAVYYNMPTLVKRLLLSPYEINPNLRSGGETPLEIAVANNDLQMVTLLLEQGADLKALTHGKVSLLHLACKSGHNDIAQFLIEKGAEVDKDTILSAINHIHKISLDLFKSLWQQASIEPFLEEKLLLRAVITQHAPLVEFILSWQDERVIHEVSDLGRSALHLAAKFANPSIFQLLIKAGLSLDQRDYLNDTPVMTAFYCDTFAILGLTPPQAISLDQFALLRTELGKFSEFSGYPSEFELLGQCCFKLISLFAASDKAMAYIKKYQSQKSSQLIHDLCLFNLPETGPWNQANWARLAMDHGPELTRFLHLAAKIESILGYSPQTLAEIVQLDIHYPREEENQELAALFTCYQIPESAFNRVLDRYLPKQEDHMPSLYIEGKDFGEPRYYLTKLPKHDYRGFILGAMTHCCQSLGSAGEACVWYGMTSPLSAFYVVFKRGQDKDIYRLKNLLNKATQSTDINDFLDKQLTEKSQRKKYLAWCKTQAQKQGVAYDAPAILQDLRIFLKNELQKEQEGELVAQMWAWRTQESLVFDSWERLREEDDRICEFFIKAIAEQAVNQHGFRKVLLGQSGSTPELLPFTKAQKAEQPITYFNYRDSKQQWLISEAPVAMQVQTSLVFSQIAQTQTAASAELGVWQG